MFVKASSNVIDRDVDLMKKCKGNGITNYVGNFVKPVCGTFFSAYITMFVSCYLICTSYQITGCNYSCVNSKKHEV